MKPASFNPLSPLGRHNSVSPSIYGSDTLLPSHSSQTSIKASNNRPETGEPGLRFSFVSNTSLHDFKDPLSRKYTRTNFKATSEADTLEEETPAVSRRRAYTKTPTLVPSSFKPSPVQKTSSLKASGSLKSNKQNESSEKIPTLVKKKTGAASPENKKDIVENKRDVLNSPIRLERMFAQKVGVVAKRRKSCHCEWCGGISNLEKKLNRNPSMAFMPRKKKAKKEETPRDEEPISNANATMSKTSLGGSRVKVKTGPKQKSLFHSKTLGVQKLASMISSTPKPSNSQERALSIDEGQNTVKSRRSAGEDLCSWKDTGKLEDALEDVKLAFSRNASLVMEQEEEEAQNISLDDREGVKPKKKRKTKKSIRTNIKLDLKLKVSDPSSKDATSPMNNRGSERKSAFFVINSPKAAKKEVKTVRNEKFTKTFDLGEEVRHNSKGKALDSPSKFSWDKFTNQASDIMTVYSQKQTLSPPYFVKLVRTTTEPQSQPGKMKYSVLAWDKKKSPLSPNKQGSESSFLIRSNLSKSTLSQWNLERKRESVQSNGIEKDILGKRFSNFTVREGMSSPVSVGVPLKGERKKIGSRQIEKQVYTVRQSKQGK